MALWPFRRRSGRKRSRSGAALSDVEGPPRSLTEGAVARTSSKKKQRTDMGKTHRRARTYSFSPGRHDSIRIDREHMAHERLAREVTAGEREDGRLSGWDRQPTLRPTQSRRQRSRRMKKEETKREAEIRALSRFDPVRPATESWAAGRPLRRESQRKAVRGSWGPRQTSEVSLPIPGSVHSSLSSDSEFGSFRISALDSLAPRPTLRYAVGSKTIPPRSSLPQMHGASRRPIAERPPIPEETLRAHKRIDDLADDLDAGDLRELMERDSRRKERKQLREQERMQRRLARRAEKQAVEEDQARKTGTPPPENMERGVMGRELVGLGIDPPSAVVTSSKRRSDDSVQNRDVQAHVAKGPREEFEEEAGPSNALPAHQTPPTLQHILGPVANSREPVIPEDTEVLEARPIARNVEDPSPVEGRNSPSLRLGSLLRAKMSMSKSTLGSEREKTSSMQRERTVEDEATSAVSSSKTKRFSLSALLRRNTKSRNSSTMNTDRQPSFANTSREEMRAAALAQGQLQLQTQNLVPPQSISPVPTSTPTNAQAQALAKLEGRDSPASLDALSPNYLSRKPSAGTPKRTRSRFREDLPEFPISPPSSRVQSPEADQPLPSLVERTSQDEAGRNININIKNKELRRTPISMEPSPEPQQSISLASIDSEGSWLSGRVRPRGSTMRSSLAQSVRLDTGMADVSPTNSTQEELAIADDEYMSRLAPERSSIGHNAGNRYEEGLPSSDEEELGDESDMRWGAVGARPQIVDYHRHDRGTMHSQEGLLNSVESGDEEAVTESPTSPSASEVIDVQRARSVQLGKGHVRNFSAGSAKLLDLTPRNSVDGKTRSERRGSAPLHL